jgi:leucyl-tRNA synthetase
MHYKDAVKYGFYELQSARDWYREVTADVGMHAELVEYWIRAAALLITPVAPHFAEHVWSTVLNEAKSVQHARWPDPSSSVERSIVESGAYMRGTVKMVRDAELNVIKKMNKAKGGPPPFDPKKPRSVRVYVSSSFPEWQEQCVAAVKEAYAPEADKVDDAKVREILTKQGLIKNKMAMPFVQAFKVRSIASV